MELTVESAFSTGGLIGHLSYLLLISSMIMRTMWMLRVLVIASAIAGICYSLFWLGDPIGLFWEGLLLLVNIVQLLITYLLERRLRFSEEEEGFVETNFPGLSVNQKRRLLDAGDWRDGSPGEYLTIQGEPVERLCYLASGEVRITSNGVKVATCGGGAFIGEMTVLTGARANGTVKISRPCRYWAIDAPKLRDLVGKQQEIEHSLKSCFHRNLLEKLVEANRLIEISSEVAGVKI